MHPGVHFYVYAYPAAAGGESARVLKGYDRLRQAVAAEHGDIARGSAPEDQYRAARAAAAKLRPLGGRGDGPVVYAFRLQSGDSLLCAEAVGVGFQYGHQPLPGRHQRHQRAGVPAVGACVHLHPGAGIRPAFGGKTAGKQQQSGGYQACRGTDGKVVAEAVLHEQPPQPEDARRAAHGDYHGRMQDIYEQGKISSPARAIPTRRGEERKEEIHHERQHKVHAVVLLPAKAAQDEALGYQQRAGDGERGGADRAARGLGSAQAVPQQHEQRGEEKPAARVAGDGDDGVQRRTHGRYAGGEAVIAVTQEAEGVKRRGGGKGPALPELFKQEGGERCAEDGGGEIPEVVKGTLKEELRKKSSQRELFQAPGIDVYGQVQGDAGEVDDGALF